MESPAPTISKPTVWWDERGEVYNIERLWEKIRYAKANPRGYRGLTTGWHELDTFFTFRKRQVTVVSGVPNHGKSEFMDALIVNSMRDHQWKWSIFSPENFPYEDHFEKVAEKICKTRFEFIPDKTLDSLMVRLKDMLFWVYPEKATLASIAEVWKNLITDCRVDACLLDPWNTVEHRRPKEQTETEYIGEALSEWVEFSRVMDVALFIVAHPTKIPVNRETGKPSLMTGYDISGSANWVNKPDNVLVVYRPDFSLPISQVHVQKVRDQRHTGQRGAVEFTYDANLGGTYEVSRVLF